MKQINQKSQIIIYQTEDGKTRVEVRFEHENVWLTQKLMAELFGTTVANINMHLKNIFLQKELDENSVIKEFLITASDGKKYKTMMYGLEVIIAVGYRVNSARSTLFRRYNNQIFLIENNIKRLIPNETVLNRYDVNLILDVNKAEWEWFGMGSVTR